MDSHGQPTCLKLQVQRGSTEVPFADAAVVAVAAVAVVVVVMMLVVTITGKGDDPSMVYFFCPSNGKTLESYDGDVSLLISILQQGLLQVCPF